MEKAASSENKKKFFNIWAPVEFCVFFYEKVYNLIERILKEKYVDKVPAKVWTAICGLILFILYAFLDNMVYWEHYRYYVIVTMAAVYLICIVMIAARNIPGKLEDSGTEAFIKNEYSFIHNKLLWVFIVMSFLMMISEYFINQERGFIGQFNILAIGFLAYVMFRTRNQKILLDGIIWSVTVAFCMLAVRVLFFEANIFWYNDAYFSLCGLYDNPSIFATVLMPALAVFLYIYDILLNSTNTFHKTAYWVIVVINCCLLGFVSYFIWETQCRTGLCALLFMMIICICSAFRSKSKVIRKIIVILLLFLSVIVVWISSTYLINNYSRRDYEEKIRISNEIVTEEVYASTRLEYLKDNDFSINMLSSDRMIFYITYFNNLNFCGHKSYCYVEHWPGYGEETPAHNSILGMAYKYGIVVGLFYALFSVIILFNAFGYAHSNSNNHKSFANFNIYTILGFGFFAMLDTMDERPFWHIVWILAYMTVAILINYSKATVDNSIVKKSKKRVRAYIIVLITIILLYCAKVIYSYNERESLKRQNAPYSIVLDDYADKGEELKKIIEGAYDIEGSQGNYQMWMKRKVNTIIHKADGCSKVIIKGYIPYDSYGLDNGEDICVNVSVNGIKIYDEVYEENGMFVAEADWSILSGEYADIKIKLDKDFVPQEVSGSEDVRKLSWMFMGIMQE